MYGIAQKKVMLEKEGISFVGGFVSGFKDLRVYPQNTKPFPWSLLIYNAKGKSLERSGKDGKRRHSGKNN